MVVLVVYCYVREDESDRGRLSLAAESPNGINGIDGLKTMDFPNHLNPNKSFTEARTETNNSFLDRKRSRGMTRGTSKRREHVLETSQVSRCLCLYHTNEGNILVGWVKKLRRLGNREGATLIALLGVKAA